LDIDGVRKHRPTHQPTKALALRFLAEVEARVARGMVGVPEPTAPERQGRALPLAGLAERFLQEANPRTKNPELYRSWLRYTMTKHVLPDLGTVAIANLKPGQIEALRDRKLADGYKSSSVNSMLKAISVRTLKSFCAVLGAMFPCAHGTRCATPSPATTSWQAGTCSRCKRSSGTASLK
jgi:hypothetical protein